ncbi:MULTISPECIES: ATP-dependent DNA helicase RecQ [unclassified Gordonia (in: high G+C Gram-positive bacteria)]|uniref:RecQ family ATP-dependent DNA helicase n=1 Tax=unclassified Gordonia (in: high G+C Gram-positive bacteria) TaxID=2657482 RepID=UPI001F0E01A0|nr:DEAD/DEAH box helicase [Gordonia sp. ABSL49_1]MCH5645259.1 DEAD/DEAH box helicase [Gordonia sp. ABSL49_1]
MTSATGTLTAAQRQAADRVITSLAGPDAALREDQLRAVTALAGPAEGAVGPRVLVVQATGWGKSAVYWSATAVIRAGGGGPTLIVSPLLSLMRDQVAAAERGGLSAATLNSSNFGEWSEVETQLLAGDLDVLLVSPERLANPGFGRRVLDALAGNLGLLVIDEAHAVSDWGHDFRPDYRRVADVLRTLNPGTPVLATTATANQRVTDDVAAQLGDQTLVLRGSLARKSLHLNVIDGMSPIARYGWVAQHIDTLPGSGIVYVLTVADADRLVTAIKAVHGPEYPVAAYSGKLDGDRRHQLEDALLRNEVKALVATSALGMGYDKPDLGFVVHVGSPPSPVSYYQQVGRAGRALDDAVVMLLASRTDDRIWDHFATATIPEPTRMHGILDALGESDEPMSVPALEAVTGYRRTRVELMLKQLAVDGAVDRTTDGWRTTGEPWEFDAPHYDGIIAVRRREADIMRAYITGDDCLMRLLIASLDDPEATACGRCSVCRGELTSPLTADVATETLRAVTGALRSSALELEPRKMWPGGAFGTRGRISADLAAEPGRVLAHADAPEWADLLAAARSGDEAALAELGDVAVATLSSWVRQGGIRPDLILSLRLTGTTLAEKIAAHLREVGRRGGGVMPVGPGDPPTDTAGAVEAAHWRDRIGEPPPEVTGRAVLLVVDATSSGWAITLAAAALRRAGASAVSPLLIHRTV